MSNLKERVAAYARMVAKRQAAARGLTVFPDDTFVVSFPRSGNTWTRFLVCNLLDPDHPVSFAEIENRIPEIYFVPDHVLRRCARPRVIKSHECFDPRYPRVIYIVRDPRDVLISNYEFQLKKGAISDACTLEQFSLHFMRSAVQPKFGSWRDHVLSWTGTRQGDDNFLLLRYEDMLANTQQEATKIASFLGVDSSPDRIARAVELSSADRMRRLEKQQARQWSATKNTRQDKPFVRKAVSGDWKSRLPHSCVARLEAEWGDVMRDLGYEPVTATQTTTGVLVPVTSTTGQAEIGMPPALSTNVA